MLPANPHETEFQSEEFFRSIADSIPQFVWTTSPDGGHEYFNQRWLHYTGMSLDEALGHGWKAILHPDDSNRCLNHWHDALETHSGYEIEFRLRRFDGAFRWHLGRAVPIKNEAGEVLKWFGTCTDIHAQKCLALERDEFIAAISHDLKNPLFSATRVLEALANEDVGVLKPQQVDLLRLVIDSNKTMTRLVQNLLEVFRYESDLSAVRTEELDLNGLMRKKALEAKAYSSFGHTISITEGIPSDETIVLGDPLSLDRLLQNLIDNALKFTPPHGRIDLSVEKQGNFAVMTVSDTGPGIPPDELPLLFQKFSQGVHGRGYANGSGLGLYFCKHIVDTHNGTIWCTSEANAKTTFYIKLPLSIRQELETQANVG